MGSIDHNEYVFNSVDEFVKYLYSAFGKLTPIKLQKGLYFLYAYYGATYGESESSGVLEEDFKVPKSLFPPRFEAWTYGPVIRSVWEKQRQGEYDSYANKEMDEELATKYPEADLFIRELFSQINSVSDFSLVDRSHEDEAWKVAYEFGGSTPIENELIIKEYKEKYV